MMTPIEMGREAQRLRAEANSKFQASNANARVWTDEEQAECNRLLDQADQLERDAARSEAEVANQQRQRAAFQQRLTSGRSIEELAERRSDPMPHNDERNARGHTGARHNFSLLRASLLWDADKRLDGLEGEVATEAAKRHSGTIKGFAVPWDLEVHPRFLSHSTRRALAAVGWSFRDLDTTTAAGAVSTVALPTMIDVLRARSVILGLGAILLEGLQGKLAIPQKTAAAGFSWVAEGSSRTPDNATIGQVPMEPKSVVGSTVISRKLMKQSSFSAEMMARQDLMDGLAVEIDRVGLNGSGAGAQPRGIAQTTGVTSVVMGNPDGGAPTWAKIVEFERVVEVANALAGSLAYVMTPAARAKLKTVERAASTAKFLWFDDNTVNSYAAYATTNLPANLTKGAGTNLSAMLFGNWEDCAFGFWGPMDIIANPYAGDTAGSLRITVLQDADFVPRRNASFARSLDVNTV
jgi:HK97 family phage major capsid protein